MLILNLHPFPVLQTGRLILRALSAADAEAAFRMRADEAVMKYIGRAPAKSIKEVHDWINLVNDLHAQNEGLLWVITLRETDEFAGTICYWNMDAANHRAEIGYMLAASHQHKGIMQEAMTTVLQYGFETIRLHSIAADVNPGNQASICLLEKNGFAREANFREKCFIDGVFCDSTVYGLINPKNNNYA